MSNALLEGIRVAVNERSYRFTPHAADRMSERRITVGDIEEALLSQKAEVIEDYPNDPRGASCLILGVTKASRPLHVQCTYPPNVAVVPAYEPRAEEWTDWRTRRVSET